MDSSIKRKGVLGKLSWQAEEFSPADWSYTVRELLKEVEPYVAYLPLQRPVGEIIYGLQDGERFRDTDAAVLSLPPGFSERTKCFRLASVSRKAEGVHAELGGCTHVYEKELFLTINVQLVISERRWERTYPGKEMLHEVAQFWKFEWCDDAQLAELMTPNIGVSIIDSLGYLFTQSVKERRARLRGMERSRKKFADVREIIKSNNWTRNWPDPFCL